MRLIALSFAYLTIGVALAHRQSRRAGQSTGPADALTMILLWPLVLPFERDLEEQGALEPILEMTRAHLVQLKAQIAKLDTTIARLDNGSQAPLLKRAMRLREERARAYKGLCQKMESLSASRELKAMESILEETASQDKELEILLESWRETEELHLDEGLLAEASSSPKAY